MTLGFRYVYSYRDYARKKRKKSVDEANVHFEALSLLPLLLSCPQERGESHLHMDRGLMHS